MAEKVSFGSLAASGTIAEGGSGSGIEEDALAAFDSASAFAGGFKASVQPVGVSRIASHNQEGMECWSIEVQDARIYE
jgi:hypothetical protein